MGLFLRCLLVSLLIAGNRVAWSADGAITILTEPRKAEVYVDGKMKAIKTPVHLRLSEGRHSVVVQSGDRKKTVEVFVPDDGHILEKITLGDAPVKPTIVSKIKPIVPQMVTIKAGSFRMGDLSGDGAEDEHPPHEVSISYDFKMGAYEITFAEYDRFCEATSCDKPDDEGWGRGARPVINVTWNDAIAYAEWLSGVTGKKYRLPSEAEWEYAARAGTNTKYWWGSDIGKNNANCRNEECGDKFENSSPVASFKPNSWGLFDTAGNVWEWAKDCGNGHYIGHPVDGSVWEDGDCSRRVLRGGSWDYWPRGASVPPAAVGTAQATGTPTSGSVWPRTYNPFIFSFFLFSIQLVKRGVWHERVDSNRV